MLSLNYPFSHKHSQKSSSTSYFAALSFFILNLLILYHHYPEEPRIPAASIETSVLRVPVRHSSNPLEPGKSTGAYRGGRVGGGGVKKRPQRILIISGRCSRIASRRPQGCMHRTSSEAVSQSVAVRARVGAGARRVSAPVRITRLPTGSGYDVVSVFFFFFIFLSDSVRFLFCYLRVWRDLPFFCFGQCSWGGYSRRWIVLWLLFDYSAEVVSKLSVIS